MNKNYKETIENIGDVLSPPAHPIFELDLSHELSC